MRTALFGQIFAPVGALPLAVRLEAAQLLAMPGRPTPLLAVDFAALPIPTTEAGRSALRDVIVGGIRPPTVASLAGLRLCEVVPGISGTQGLVQAANLPARLRAALDQAGWANWSDLGRQTLGAIGALDGVGPKAVAALLTCAVAEAFEAANAPDGARLTALDRLLSATGDQRDQAVFEHLELPIDVLPLDGLSNGGPPNDPVVTAVAVAKALEIGGERVRQLRARAVRRVREATSGPAHDARALAAVVTERLGAGSPRSAFDEVLAELGLPARPDVRSLLLLWLAGPYQPVPGHPDWLAHVAATAETVTAETARLLHEDGGVRLADHVRKDLRAIGIPDRYVDDWLGRQPVRLVDELVVLVAGSPADVAERALSALGRAMTAEELAEWGCEPGSVAGRGGLRRDVRFVQVGPNTWELSEWAGTAYNAGVGALF